MTLIMLEVWEKKWTALELEKSFCHRRKLEGFMGNRIDLDSGQSTTMIFLIATNLKFAFWGIFLISLVPARFWADLVISLGPMQVQQLGL